MLQAGGGSAGGAVRVETPKHVGLRRRVPGGRQGSRKAGWRRSMVVDEFQNEDLH